MNFAIQNNIKIRGHNLCWHEQVPKWFFVVNEADPNAKLYHNDYNTEGPEKRDRIYRLLKNILEKKVPIDGVGLQAHRSIDEPTEYELRTAIQQYSSLGLKMQFTEVDVSIYPWEKNKRNKNPDENDHLTPELEQKQLEKYKMVFKVFREFKSVITNVTFWNVSDRYSWLDEYPVRRRKNYPLLFDAKLEPKKAFWEVVNFKK